MSSTFTGIEIGKRGILAHQTALYVTGHNVSNAETEGYSRQKVTLETLLSELAVVQAHSNQAEHVCAHDHIVRACQRGTG